ncbi:hypothetical protein FBY31_0626 [Arthrobacter sp. SLBN-100]|uniref:hypothetical protein n=1 Tax=Arthrobacter sp. SLBN-100 TaxID=2768450 RepID=UPI00116EC20A|nr:hypothetical protein [Arthrobacter sp. SLBN-100]TQJ66590.1 hypothetical protein FBY31_0626 [Arthrobacter sp. SLBN-100]
MRRTLLENGIAKAQDGFTVIVRGLGEDRDAGVASVATAARSSFALRARAGLF